MTRERHIRELSDLAELERLAWEDYRESLNGLAGREYEDAEHDSWERLQERLDRVAAERELVEAG